MKVKIELKEGNYIESSTLKVDPKERFYLIENVEWAEIVTE